MIHRLQDFVARHETRIVLALLLLGYVLRLAWLFLEPSSRLGPHRSEMWLVTEHWARTGQMADAYGPGSGISSHVGPVNVVIAGMIYRWFGTGTLTSEFLLSMISGAYATLLFWFLYRLAGELAIPRPARMLALLILVLVPFDYYSEVVDFRIREGVLAATLAAGLLWWVLVLDRTGASIRQIFLYGLAAGFAFLVHPGVAMGAYLALGVVILRHVRFPRWPAVAAVVALGFVLMNGAWIARNYLVYDRFMPSRGNFWLEVSTSNHPSLVGAEDPRAAFQKIMRRLHPRFSTAAFESYKEYPLDVDYFDHLGAETRAWIRDNPGDFARLSVNHLRDLLFPRIWVYNPYGREPPSMSDRVKQAWHWSLMIAFFAGLALGFRRLPRRYLLVVLSLLPVVLLYALVQPTIRYRYLFSGLITMLAVSAGWQLVVQPLMARWTGTRRGRMPGDSSQAAPGA